MLSIARRTTLCRAVALALSLPVAATAFAQEAAPTAAQDEAVTQFETVRTIGSRRIDRTSDTTTPVPVDVLPMSDAAEHGAQFDLAQTLQYTAPSFNSTRQTGADGADLVDGAALRGLGSDQTLVLVNGKRHHTVSLVNIYGARDRGNTGTDLNAIPLLAIDRIEILRDGAAAQYGSDAIAGVMNIALKRSKGCEAVLGWGQYSEGDGENLLASAYCGVGFAMGGGLSVTGEWQDRDRSNRATDFNPLRTIGDSKVENRTVYLNGDAPLGEVGEVYFTAGMQNRDASSAAWARGGIGSDDIPSRNSEAMYPDGFVPFIDGVLDDRYGIIGLRGDAGAWHWDVSYTHGYNEFEYTIRHTLNASIANLDRTNGGAGISPSEFDAGGFSFEQDTANFDVSRYFDGVLNGLNVAFGAEAREERYRIRAGEPGSYQDVDGVGEGGNAGSQGFPGFQPGDVTDRSRDSTALYADFELDVTDRFMTAFAVRYEDYSDFGDTLNGKLAAAFHATDNLLLRGSVSTGFRAPSLQQKYFSSTITDFIGGQPVDIVIAPNDSALAQAAGIPNLVEEQSTSVTLGLTWAPRDNLSVTLDAYRIEIDDRVVLSGEFDNTDPNIGPVLDDLGVGLARFFFNSVDTRTTGVDLTVSHDMALGGGKLASFLGLNYGKTEITQVHTPPQLVGREDTLLSERERLFIEGAAPRLKAVAGFDYTWGKWAPSLKVIHFGKQTLGTWTGGGVHQDYDAKTSADVSLTYSFTDKAKFTVGASNIFDVYPTRQDPNETDNGHIYESVQFGINGASYFARFWMKF
ncbi:TonB-dependent receptor plug domain-containing protein [Aerolutibacter ruishenii]|uniref:Iron complex outermembrane receptor protein n=1 Tax=Aerolutibacter ruishenii TaxID=686800 RepID=A0A562LKT6_9GAMM|nr:TonB-dependent receptor [Lysobacter ruishenii]TWI08225.1 iron complex outermembrane receptor protein [Lysobacter ruishenii]